MTSTLSGTERADASELATVSRNVASSKPLALVWPWRWPNWEVTVRLAPPLAPLVAPPREAIRMLRCSSPASQTAHPCARDIASTRCASSSASSLSSSMSLPVRESNIVASGVEHVYPAEARRHGAVGDRRALHRLALGAAERAAEKIGRAVAEAVHRAPETLRLGLVGDEDQHLPALAVLDLVELLPAELEIVALLVDAPAAVADDQDAVVDPADEVLEARRLRVRLQRHVGHALDGKRRGAVRIGAAVGSRFPDQRRLPDRHLVVAEHPVLDDRKTLVALHAVVVIGDAGEPALLVALGDHVHQLAAECELAELVRGDEGGAGVIGFPAERAI